MEAEGGGDDDDGEMELLAILHQEDRGELVEEEEEERWGNQPPPGEQEQRYQLRSIETILVIRQLPSQGLSFQLWPAASSLVSLLDHNPSLLLAALPAGRRRPPNLNVLELGSGTGLVGIAAAAVLGARVAVTDLPHVLPNLRFNALANAAAVGARGGSVEARQLRWGHHGEDAAGLGGGAGFDLVLASDVVYHDHLFDPLLRTLRFFVRGEAAFVMAHLRRWKKRDSVFFRSARKLFDVTVVHTDPPLPGSRVGVAIYRFVQKGSPSCVGTAAGDAASC
uniref:Methyltransferase-like protein 21C n=1 Tax=Anthurium amnicola TaxID=1678845 RepID=A0A1D1XIG0_9ARAE